MPSSEPKNIPLNGLFPLPPGLETASVPHRAKFWKLVGQEALRLKRGEIESGVDIWGNKFQTVKRQWGDPTPLLPHGQASRTYRLLSLNSTARGATLFWRAGGGRVPWPKILGYHAYRHGPRNLPVRNEIGLSPRSVEALMARSAEWQAGYEAGLEAGGGRAGTKAKGQETRLERILREKKERAARGIAYAPAPKPAPAQARPSVRPVPAPAPQPAVHPVEARILAHAASEEKRLKILDLGSGVLEATSAKEDAARRMEELLGALKGTKGAERKRLKAELDRVSGELESADLRASKLKREARAKVMAALVIEDKSQRLGINLIVDEDNPLSARGNDTIVGSLNFVSRITAKTGDVPVNMKFSAIPKDEPQRAHHLGGKDGLIRVSADADPSTTIHEIGHLLESRIPGWEQKANEFLRYRVGDEPLSNFYDVLGKQYGKTEVGRKDKFDEVFGDELGYYVGKHYSHGATEITAMGIEKLFNDPVTFAAKDPEFFRWIVGMLDGGLR